MKKSDPLYKKAVTDGEFNASSNHGFKVLRSGKEFRSIVPAPLAEDFAMEWLDELSAWSWIAGIRENHVSGKRWPIEGKMNCAKCLWKGLGCIPVDENDSTEEVFLHFEVGTSREEIWHWFEHEFDVSVAEDLMHV